MKSIITKGLGAMLLIFLSSCSNYQYYAVQSGNADMNRYRTFAWLPHISSKNEVDISDIADEKITDETTAQLEVKGLRLLAKNPDLLVRYSVMVNEKVKTFEDPIYTYPLGGRYAGRALYRGGRGYYYAYTNPYPVYLGENIVKVPYKEGTLIIDLVDRKSSKVIWRGYGVGEIENPVSAVKDIPEVVQGIIAKLPLKIAN